MNIALHLKSLIMKLSFLSYEKNVSWYTSLVYTELMNSDKTQILKSYIWYFFASLDTIDKEDVDKQHNIKCLIFGLDAQW